MSEVNLETAAASIAAQFEYKDEDLLIGVSEFIREMSEYRLPPLTAKNRVSPQYFLMRID